eukprot:TRINITY_DN2774_c0_g1_i1.p1 TRINITY_DN2774_c0_g1~~TRINITY_DN2774_c0_g1_i1.p1  ORF type:complete len:165 (-),score=29.47 TRINITY_DN2774_c0_g1_i1:225-719(-)
MSGSKHSVVFVCTGNICRSPMGEVVMKHLLRERGLDVHWEVDSCGTTGYHVGDRPDERSAECCKNNLVGMAPITHLARQVHKSDFTTFEYMLCMDNSHLEHLKRIKPAGATTKLSLLGAFDPTPKKDGLEVRDPYFDSMKAFQQNFEQILRCCTAFLDSIYGKE